MKSMKELSNVHAGHRRRVREKYQKIGLACFADHEILELLLFHSVPYKDTNPLAHKLLEHFGSLEDVFAASVDELKEIDGVSENSAILIHLVSDLVGEIKRRNKKTKQTLNGFSASIAYAKDLFANEQIEKVYAILLDRINQVKATKEIATGSSTAAIVNTKILAKFVLQKDVDRIILAHNHPIGSSEPSDEDIVFTRNIIETLLPLGIEVLDHIVVGGDGSATSFAHEGLLQGQTRVFPPIVGTISKQKK